MKPVTVNSYSVAFFLFFAEGVEEKAEFFHK